MCAGADKIKAVLTLILGGDKQAAEYTLAAIISRIYKKEALFLMGNMALNLTGVTQAQSKMLQKFLLQICPLFCIFESSVKELNESVWQPVKDYNLNRLIPSILGEMPGLASLLIDETKMDQGQLDARGVKNITAIT